MIAAYYYINYTTIGKVSNNYYNDYWLTSSKQYLAILKTRTSSIIYKNYIEMMSGICYLHAKDLFCRFKETVGTL
jgi:hypothetical protein